MATPQKETTQLEKPNDSASQPSQETRWRPPTRLEGVQVLPDRYTPREKFEPDQQLGKSTDPGRMGIYICLLDDRPHLHPTLTALHRHRHTAHGIPLPTDPANHLPTSTRSPVTSGSPIAKTSPPSDQLTQDVSADSDAPKLQDIDVDMIEENEQLEWIMWKFSTEEEARRKAYLPLD